MFANIIAYSLAGFLFISGVWGLIGVGTGRYPRHTEDDTIIVALIFIVIALVVAKVAGI